MALLLALLAAVGQDLDEVVQRTTKGGFWGVVLVAVKGEVVLAKGYGNADYAKTPMKSDTLLEIASTSKQFTAAAILKLETEGKLKTDDPLSKIFKNVPDDKKAITVHQLLTHTSGISENIGLPYASPATREQFLDYVWKQPLASKPGEKFAYSNCAYALLAAIVEIASGQTFEAYSKDKLFKPAKMTDTGFVTDKDLDAKRAATRLSTARRDWTSVNWFWSWGYRGMGGVVTTAHDLLKWDRALRGETVLNAKAKEKLYAPVKARYACGWLVETTDRGTTKVHHSGGVEGFVSQYSRYLEDDVVIVVLSNGATDVFAVEKAIAEALIPRAKIEGVIRWKKYKLSEYQAVELPKTTTWAARANGASVVLELRDGDHAAAEIAIPRAKARSLAAELQLAMQGKKEEKTASMDAGLYLGGYELGDGDLKLSGLEIQVRAQYVGIDDKGNEVVDDRITVVFDDPAQGQWPVMTILSLPAAKHLLDQLRAASK